MGVPFRGIAVVGRWRRRGRRPRHGVADFVITEPEAMSRVFSPLARYKLYDRLDDNVDWEIDFSRPDRGVGLRVRSLRRRAAHRLRLHARRHVPRADAPRGCSRRRRRALRHPRRRQDAHPGTRSAPWFGYFAETFLPPRDVFQFGEELDHLEASRADATLGDLQSTVVGPRGVPPAGSGATSTTPRPADRVPPSP